MPYLIREIQGTVPRVSAEVDLFHYFQDTVAPAFSQLLRSVPDAVTQGAMEWVRLNRSPHPSFSRIPVPQFPEPALLLFGRFWHLQQTTAQACGLSILHNGAAYAITGSYVSVAALTAKWKVDALRSLLGMVERPPSKEVAPDTRHFREFQRVGFVETGDLILLKDGMLLGHVIPAHYSSTLSTCCDRSLAILAPLNFCDRIPADEALLVAGRSGDGWRLLPLRRRVCLGARPNEIYQPGENGNHLRLAVFLRFAAFRIAANGRFHEQDSEGELCQC
jgi:hypothetical protein